MEHTGKSPRALISLVRMLSVGMLIIRLTIAAPDARGQLAQPAVPSFTESRLAAARNKVRNIYTNRIGIREKQPNSGADVEKFLRYVNLPKGNPWCAAFVCWVYGQAGVENPRSGWSPDLFRKSRVIWVRGEAGTMKWEPGLRENTIWEQGARSKEQGSPQRVPFGSPSSLVTRNPQAGDIFGIYFPEKGRIAHVGFVDEWSDAWVTTVEGNTNVPGSREGDGVYRKRRLTRSVYKVARYVN